MVERLHGMQEVSGSIPLTSTRIKEKNRLLQQPVFLFPLFGAERACVLPLHQKFMDVTKGVSCLNN